MQVFIFQSGQRGDLAAYTRDWEGKNLPADAASWMPRGAADIHPGDAIGGIVGGADAVIEGIDRDGVFVVPIEANASLYPATRRGFW